MSTPVCIANAIADALGAADVPLPATPRRIHAMMRSRQRQQDMKPRPFDYVRPDTVEEAVALLAEYGDDARILAGGQSLIADAQSAADRCRGADRYFAHRRTRRHRRARRHDRDRRRGDAEQTDGVAAACAKAAARSPRRCRSSAIFRPATKARCAARSRMPIRARNCRWRSRCWAARWCCARATRRARARRASAFQKDMLTTARGARRIDRRGAFSGHRGQGRGFRRSGAAAWRFRHRRGGGRNRRPGAARCGSASAAWRGGRWCAGSTATPRGHRRMGRRARRLRGFARLARQLRRDLFRNLAPLVIEEANRCAA